MMMNVIYTVLLFGLITCLVFMSYQSSTYNEYAFDDLLAIVNNKDVNIDSTDRDPVKSQFNNNNNDRGGSAGGVDAQAGSYTSIWVHDIWGKDLRMEDSHKSYRPLLISLFRFLWKSVSSDAYIFRLLSISVHAAASCLLYCIARCVWYNESISIASAILFAVHPIHVEAVAAVVNMAEPLSCCFILLSYLVFLRSTGSSRSIDGGSHSNSSSIKVRDLITSVLQLMMWIICAVISILFKETGLICCVLVVGKSAIDLMTQLFRWLFDYRKEEGKRGMMLLLQAQQLTSYVVFNCSSLFLVYVYFMLRNIMTSWGRDQWLEQLLDVYHSTSWQQLIQSIASLIKTMMMAAPSIGLQTDSSSSSSSARSYLEDSKLLRKAENPYAFLRGQEKVLSTMHLHFLYMTKMIYPSQQAPEYAFDCIPKVSELHDIRAVSAIGLYALVVMVLLLGIWNIFWSVRRGFVITATTTTTTTTTTSTSGGTTTHSIKKDETGTTYDDDDCDGDDDAASVEHVNDDADASVVAGAVSANKFLQGRDDDSSSSNSSNSFLPPEAVLHTLMWFVVCFAPMSGLVFKLGTLLAERLLYMPSIAICMFIPALINYILRKSMSRVMSAGLAYRLYTILFWSCIMAISSVYIHRTLSYSQVWKSEENLFLESLSVCPNSAKLNLQVARIHLRHQQHQKAKQHLNKAKLIDPDFCDLHYFEAVVLISMNEDVDTAIDLLVRSLHCIYTSQSAIMLLYQIWDNQLQQAQAMSASKHRYYKLLEQQGLAAQKHDINFIAVKKLIDASSIAFEERQYKDAINLSTKAEKMVLRSEAAQRNLSTNGSSSGDSSSIEGQMVTAEMRCRIFTLIGCYRYFLVSNNMHEGGQGQGKGSSSKKTLPLTSKSPQYQATVAKKHLTRAIEQDCFEAILKAGDDQIPSIVIEHIPIAIQHIVTMYSIGSKTTGDKNTSEVIERSIRLTNAFIVLNVMLHKVIAKMDGNIPTTQNQVALMTTNNGIMHNEHLLYSGIHERLTQSLKTIEMVASSEWTNCGLLFYRQNNYPKALKCFTEKLKLLCNNSNNQRVSTVLSEFVHDRGMGNYSGILITARTKAIVPHFLDLQLTSDICSTLHWYGNIYVVAHPDFRYDLQHATVLVDVLKKVIDCFKTRVLELDRTEQQKITAMYKELKTVASIEDDVGKEK